MGKIHSEIDERLANWIQSEHVFFVATAPLAPEGNLNLSPKGLDSFCILRPNYPDVLRFSGTAEHSPIAW